MSPEEQVPATVALRTGRAVAAWSSLALRRCELVFAAPRGIRGDVVVLTADGTEFQLGGVRRDDARALVEAVSQQRVVLMPTPVRFQRDGEGWRLRYAMVLQLDDPLTSVVAVGRSLTARTATVCVP